MSRLQHAYNTSQMSLGAPHTPGLRSTAKEILRPLVKLALLIVRNEAHLCHGTVESSFSQMHRKVIRRINRYEDTREGICGGLAAVWLAERAQGHNLFDSLYKAGKKIDEQALETVMKLQIHDNDGWATLEGAGLKKGTVNKGGGSGQPYETSQLIHDLLGQGRNTAGSAWSGQEEEFKIIALAGKNFQQQHALALHRERTGKITFFDPNSGVFSFRNGKDFAQWFNSYLRVSLYRIGLGQHYHIQEWEKPSGAPPSGAVRAS
ncbi:hypothetical protein GCM10011289_06620 [Paludibacterium paludis]|uniref:Peptidase C58 YopT-type domain-containing protein n=1 Tax=Paludibacterium paludis TaxID=1225769 RepID=A0A918NYP7_9NEIS|nr:hypothetical protein GCM10011289_06620 [Paludibacterium paludis]